jgi:AAA+ superfamily predicted ATPase
MMKHIQKTSIDMHFIGDKNDAFKYYISNPNATLKEFLGCYPARTQKPIPEKYLSQSLKYFTITPVKLKPDEGHQIVATSTDQCSSDTDLKNTLDALYEADVNQNEKIEAFPEEIKDREAVLIAYRQDLQDIARFLKNDLSVLIMCDKMLTEYIYEYVCKLAGKLPVLDDALPEPKKETTRDAFDQNMQGDASIEKTLPLLIRNLKSHQVLVIRSVDLLDNPSLVEVLYQGSSGDRKSQLLGFLDPSLEIKKVLSNRFAVHRSIMGLPRHIQPDDNKPPIHTVSRLVTANERKCFHSLDPEGVYKNVSGLNVIQFRNAMRYVGATVADNSDSRYIYQVIRHFKTSSSEEIEIPDTTFDNIGGYERVKQELKRIIMLVAGRVKGIDEKERARLTPRGFVFHGKPGTGKTLFAKAIANEMNATIQMVSGPEIMDKYVGQSESNLRKIFNTARRNAPSVIFFDEFDSIAGQRTSHAGGGERANNAVVAQLLTELDGFRQDQAVLVIGTTNRIDIIDEALLRPSRLRPIEISEPDYAARREVARIHAKTFGVDVLLTQLFKQAQKYLNQWQKQQTIPQTFLKELFDHHAPHKLRHENESYMEGFREELKALFAFLQASAASETASSQTNPLALKYEKYVLQLARKYNLDLTRPQSTDASEEPQDKHIQQHMADDIRDLFEFVQHTARKDAGMLPENFVKGILNLIAEYTDGFNNDEIRAIFQEASLEHHLEGRLITPRYLGMKIGLLKKRRDEREITHLSHRR